MSAVRSLVAVLALVSAFPVLARAQLPEELRGRRVVDVRVAGETSGATSARDVGIPIGAPLTRALLRSTVQRLLGSGRWADVQVDAQRQGDGVALVVHLVPRIVITRVDVAGNEVASREDIVDSLGLGEEGELEDRDLAPLVRAVQAVYAQRGYVDAEVSIALRDTDDPSRKVLRVEVIEHEPLRIDRYVFDPEPPPEDFDLPAAIGMGEGDVLDRTRLRDGIDQAARVLRREGWLEARLGTPQIERHAGRAQIAIRTRFGPRYEVRLRGYEPLERSAIEGALQLEDNRLTQSEIDALELRVLDLLRRHGFHEAEVEVLRYAGEREGTAVLEVRVTLGRQLDVVGMSFPGATHFSTDYLRDQLISVLEEDLPDTRLFSPVDSETLDRIGVGGRSVIPRERRVRAPLHVDPSRVFYEPLYTRAIEHLVELYQADGYLNARIGEPRLENVGRGRAIVVISVLEGARTLLHGVTLDGNTVVGDRELLRAAGFERDQPFSYLTLEDAIERMTDLYRERGYLYARVEPDVRFSEDRSRARVALRIVERYEVRFGRVHIEGAVETSRGLIRGVLRFREGDLFTPSAVTASQEALMGLGVFQSVNIAPRDADLPERVKPIVVTVRERMPQYVDVSGGISTGQGARASAEYGYRNLFGYALAITLRAQLGIQFFFQDEELQRNIEALSAEKRLERRITATLALPQIEGLQNLRYTLDLIHVRDNERAFGLDKNGLVLSINWRPERWLNFTLAGELEYNGVELFGDRTSIAEILEMNPGDQRLSRLLRVPQGESFVGSVQLAGSVDQRDSPFVPTTGWFTSATAEWVRTIDVVGASEMSDPFLSHFLKLGFTASGYIPIGDVVLAGQLRIGGIVHLERGSRTYPNRQYFLGGVDSLRGFYQDQVQPQDIADLQRANPDARTSTVLQGGDFFYLVRAEVRFPLYGSLHGAVFGDIGNHWADPASIVLNENFVRPTAGFGLRLATPVGPLAADVGFNLLRREELNEPDFAVHFSFGVF